MATSDLLPWKSECELAAAVVASPLFKGWAVLQEVPLPEGHASADIVATRLDEGGNARHWIIECKRVFSASVLAQAKARKPYADRVSVAVPQVAHADAGRNFLLDEARAHGIGVLLCSRYMVNCIPVCTVVPAGPISEDEPRERTPRRVLRVHEGQRNGPRAGSAGVKRFGANEILAAEVVEFVAAHPGCELKHACPREHRAMTPREIRRVVERAIEGGEIAVRIERERGAVRLYPAEAAA